MIKLVDVIMAARDFVTFTSHIGANTPKAEETVPGECALADLCLFLALTEDIGLHPTEEQPEELDLDNMAFQFPFEKLHDLLHRAVRAGYLVGLAIEAGADREEIVKELYGFIGGEPPVMEDDLAKLFNEIDDILEHPEEF